MISPEGQGGRAPSLRTWLPVGLVRSELLLVALLLAVSAVAWLLTNRLSMPDMRLGILTGGAHPDGAMDAVPMGQSVGAGLFLTTWLVMMTAMMLPSVTPVVVRVTRLMRARGAGDATAYAMTAGYLLVWGLIGSAAYGVFLALQTLEPGSGTTAVRVGALILVVAGAYQLSPLKRVCLRHCRSPLAVLAHYGETIVGSRAGALRVGIRHGTYCLGCCWALMVILLAAGMMSLVWMAVIAAIVFAEKTYRRGEGLSRVLGAFLIVLGLVLVAVPGALPALT
ncbi:MAG: DUF2182 domain-containing protein [Carbonactinosporaceae bacterium]